MKDKEYDDFWDSGFERLMVNSYTYRGKGRPRKVDYITLEQIHRFYNKSMNEFLDKMKLNI